MVMIQLHRDWPEFRPTSNSWEHGNESNPHVEVRNAFEYGFPECVTASAPQSKADYVGFDDIASVERYYLESNMGVWEPGQRISTECKLVLLGQLIDGRWFTLSAWNDYTGWSCRCGGTVVVGGTRDELIQFGLDDTERKRLGVRS